MEFIADSEFIFSVWAAGRRKLISFGERSEAGVSVYTTKDPVVAQAIRNHRYFRQGRIQEDMSKADDLFYDKLPDEKDDEAGQSPTSAEQTKEPETADDEAENTATPKAEIEATAGGPVVKDFTSITFAKNWLSKEYGIDKKTLKTPEQVIEAGKEHGVIIKF